MKTNKKDPSSIRVINQDIDNTTIDDVVKRAKCAIDDNGFLTIATVNPEFLVLSARDEKFSSTLKKFDIKVPDGFGTVALPRLLGRGKFKQRITGVDLSWKLLALAGRSKYKIMLLGASRDNSQKACAKIRANFPSICVKCISGGVINPFDIKNDLKSEITAFKPDILLVGLGAPKQEYFITNNARNLGINVAIGVGGTIDFLSGASLRAPEWMQSIGIEWLWRLFIEPRRWRRIFTAVFVFPCVYIRSLFKNNNLE